MRFFHGNIKGWDFGLEISGFIKKGILGKVLN